MGQHTKRDCYAKILDQYIEKLGLTYEELGAILGVTRSSVHRWHRKKTTPTPRHQVKLIQLQELYELLLEKHKNEQQGYMWLVTPTKNNQNPLQIMKEAGPQAGIEVMEGGEA